jgi:hypothetical protein
MKKIYIILISIAAGVCLAIGGVVLTDLLSKDQNEGTSQETQQLNQPTQDQATEKAQDEANEKSQYKSPDLKMLHAKGNVRSIEGIPAELSWWLSDQKKIIFTRDGVLAFTLDKKLLSNLEGEVERDEFGRFISIRDFSNTINELGYNEDGFIATYSFYMEGCGGTTKYEYNEKDELTKTVFKGECEFEFERFITVSRYSNYLYDSHDNWISRKVKEETKTYNLDDDLIDTETNTYTEKRTIKYFD